MAGSVDFEHSVEPAWLPQGWAVRALGVPDVDRRRHHLRVRLRFDAEAGAFVRALEAMTGYEGPA